MLPDSLLLALAALSLLIVPGLLIAATAGLRGWLLVGSAPAVTLGAAGVLGPVLSLLGIGWSPIPVLLGILVLAGVVAALMRPWKPWAGWAIPAQERPDSVWSRWHHVAVAAAAIGMSLLGAYIVVRGTSDLTGIHQYWDAMFHANAVRYIADTGDANPTSLGLLAQPNNPGVFYPDVYHAIAALEFRAGVGGDVPTTLNAVAAAIPAIFVLSMVAMARVLIGRPAVVFCVALVAGMFSAFPYDLLNFGPLWPFALALAAAPAVVALVNRLLYEPSPSIMLVTAITAGGLVSTHPAVAGSVAIIALCQVAVWVWERRGRIARRSWLALGGALALTLLFTATVLRGVTGAAGLSTGVDWPAWTGPGSALGILITLNHENLSPQWILAGLMFVGLFVLRRWRQALPLAPFAALMAVFFVISSAYDTPLVQALTSFWWNDRWRFIALFILPAALFAGLGLAEVRDLALRLAGVLRKRLPQASMSKLPARLSIGSPAVRAGALALLTVVLVLATGVGYRLDNVARVAAPYQDGPTVSSGERAAYQALAEMYDGGRVMNDPADGSPWAYALEDIPLVFQAPLSAPYTPELIGEDRLNLLYDFDRYGSDDAVDQTVEDLDIRWIVLGEGFAAPGFERSLGLDDLDDNRRLREVFDNGSAQIYEVLR